MKRSLVTIGVVSLLICASCQTTPRTPVSKPTATRVQFEPATYVARINHAEGGYSNMFESDSYAVWVTPQVVDAKRDADIQDGETPDEYLERLAAQAQGAYHIFECHIQSTFPDMSIAYDVVGFRNLDVYLEMPDGTKVYPAQRIIGSHADEEQVGALKQYGRTNILLFPKEDLWLNAQTIKADANAVRLVIQGHDSTYYFEWPALPTPAPSETAPPPPQTRREAAMIGFNEFFSKLRGLSQYLR